MVPPLAPSFAEAILPPERGSRRAKPGSAGRPLRQGGGRGIEIRDLRSEDWPEVVAIYEAGIRTGHATFETDVPSWEAWDGVHLHSHRLVAVEGGRVVGWAALSPASSRECYAGVVEESVYVAAASRGRGIGRALLERLIEDAEQAGIWTIQTSIFPENRASLLLHAVCGFRVVGVRERIGQLDGRWRDTVFLERRTKEI